LVHIVAIDVVDTGGQFDTSLVDTGGKFAAVVIDTEMTLTLFSGAWRKVIHEKT
jgi:hypothetical protein